MQKTHGLTKMQYYMCLFGSGYNFVGGPGEANHKTFVKDTGNNTQIRINSFVSQCVTRYYETLILDLAKIISDKTEMRGYERIVRQPLSQEKTHLLGRFCIDCTGDSLECDWVRNDARRPKCQVSDRFEKTLIDHMKTHCRRRTFTLYVYIGCQLHLENRVETFCATL